MKTFRKHKAIVALSAALIAWGWSAWAQQGPVGQGLSDAGRAMRRGFQTAGQAVQGGFQRTRTSVHNMEVVSRVYSRLHWDKALLTSNIELTVQAGGIATLTGVVPSDEAKAKALSLTADTVGVLQVVDQLTVGSLTRAAPVVPGNAPVIVAPSGSTIVKPAPSTTAPKPSETDTPL